MALPIDSLKAFFLTHGFARTYWIGYSGGLDSHVLLHLCVELRKLYPLRLKAVHIHHGLSVNAQAWADHCSKVCADLQIDCIQKTVDAKPANGDSPEEIAREKRYAFFAELLNPQDILLTAHQQDDQAETVLVQLLRGAGPKGLAAMPLVKPFGMGFHARPFLTVPRVQLQEYADAQQLTWVEDESNTNKNFTRNFLRHEIVPLLKQRWPTVTQTLARVAENCAEASELVTHQAQQDLVACYDENKRTLLIKKLIQMDAVRQRQVLRAWLNKLDLSIPSAVKLKQIQQDFISAREDKSPFISWNNVELRRYQYALYAMPCLPLHDPSQEFVWDVTCPLVLPNLGELQGIETENPGLRLDVPQVTVRFRQGGERCYFPKRRCHQSLKHLLQKWQVPPWERDRVPLVFVGDRLVAVVGHYLAEDYTAMPGRELLLKAGGANANR